MEKTKAIALMSALSQPTRYDVFMLLARALPHGKSSGDLAIATTSSPNTMSAHLAILARAGLVSSDKVGRHVIYRAVMEPVAKLAFLLSDTCGQGEGINRPVEADGV